MKKLSICALFVLSSFVVSGHVYGQEGLDQQGMKNLFKRATKVNRSRKQNNWGYDQRKKQERARAAEKARKARRRAEQAAREKAAADAKAKKNNDAQWVLKSKALEKARKAQSYTNNLAVRRKIGQMVMVGFRGTSTRDKGVRAVIAQIKSGQIGGVMLMAHNIRSIAQVRQMTNAMRAAARAGGQMPPFITVDQEGGRVQRLKFTRFPSHKRAATLGKKYAASKYNLLACQVHAAGINVNFGPVVDMDIQGAANPIIGRLGRSFGRSSATVSQYAGIFVAAHKRYGVMTTAKHFPGHGSSLNDSHKGFTAIPRWSTSELKPFRDLAAGGVNRAIDMVMVGHLFNKRWGAPASISHKAVAGMLRRDVGFRGVAITDDMEMGAIRKNYAWTTALKRAVNAGIDVVLYSNTARYSTGLGPRINRTIADSLCRGDTRIKGCIPPKVIEAAYQRIARIKQNAKRIASFRRPASCR